MSVQAIEDAALELCRRVAAAMLHRHGRCLHAVGEYAQGDALIRVAVDLERRNTTALHHLRVSLHEVRTAPAPRPTLPRAI